MQAKKVNSEKNFSQRLREALTDRTQTSVSTRLKCSQAVLSAYMAGDLPRSFDILVRLAQEYDIDLHWLLTGERSPVVANLTKALKPHVLAFLAEINRQAQALCDEQISLLQVLDRSKEQNAHLEEIREDIKAIHAYYNEVVDSLNDALEPFGERISDRIPPTWRRPKRL